MGKKGIGGFVSSVANVGGHLNPLGNTLTAFNFLSGGGKGGSPGPKLDQSKFENRQEVYDRTKQAREASQGLISDLQKQAKGEGPSLAEAQLKSATSRNLAQTLAAAAAGRGSNPALTQRNVLQQKGAADRATAEQGAMLRMQEQQTARDQLGNLALNQQSQDLAQVVQPAGIAAQGEQTRFQADVDRRRAVQQQQNQLVGNLFNAGSSIGAAFLSDESQKENIKPAKKEIGSFLDALSARQYNYKNESAPGAAPGKRVGILAQDLEKSKLGKSLVKDTEQGKMVDTVQGFGAVLAAQAELNERLKKLEKKGKA